MQVVGAHNNGGQRIPQLPGGKAQGLQRAVALLGIQQEGVHTVLLDDTGADALLMKPQPQVKTAFLKGQVFFQPRFNEGPDIHTGLQQKTFRGSV